MPQLSQLKGASRNLTQVVAPDVRTLVELLEIRAREGGLREQCAHIWVEQGREDRETGFDELWHRSKVVAQSLIDGGMKRGDRVMIMVYSGEDFAACFFGVLIAGGVCVPAEPPFFLHKVDAFVERFSKVVESSGSRFVIAASGARLVAEGLAHRVACVESVLSPKELMSSGTMILDSKIESKPNDIAFLQYTSGSTGEPKGIAISHRCVMANVHAIGDSLGARQDEVTVSWLPLFHDMGLIGCLLTAMYWGTPLVLITPQHFVKRPEVWLQAISKYKGTVSPAPNFAYRLCSKLSDDRLQDIDLSSWRSAMNGAEAVCSKTIKQFEDRFGSMGFRQESTLPVYGLAESTLAVSFPPQGRSAPVLTFDTLSLGKGLLVEAAENMASQRVTRMVSVGMPVMGLEVRVVSNTGLLVDCGVVGELQVRGDSVMEGSWQQQGVSRSRLIDGWLPTGDLAGIYDGEIYIVGREKDLIIQGGRNIYPEDIEAAIREVSTVRKGGVVVFSSPRDEHGESVEEIVAIVEVDKGGELRGLADEIAQSVQSKTGSTLDDIVLVPPKTVLKTSSGKIQRGKNRQRYISGELNNSGKSFWKIGTTLTPLVLDSLWSRGRTRVRRFFTAAEGGEE
jgi:acyl-CoA synthetase (AMP-forming)/AMP-acid ligase II